MALAGIGIPRNDVVGVAILGVAGLIELLANVAELLLYEVNLPPDAECYTQKRIENDEEQDEN